MMTADGPKVIEFNVRLGDPETQPLMHRLEGGFGEALLHAATGNLQGTTLRWKPEPSVCVVLAAHGYPGQVRTGDPITGIDAAEAEVFHAGTKLGPHGHETSGGRVLGVTASGPDLASAVRSTYAAVDKIHFAGNALPQRHRPQGFAPLAPGRAALAPCYNRSVCGDVAQMDRAAAS